MKSIITQKFDSNAINNWSTDILLRKINLILQALLIGLFVYAATSKLIDLPQARHQMLNQIFPKAIALLFLWLVPLTELLISLLIMNKKTKISGLFAYILLMSAFIIYILLVSQNIFGRIPCSCGGAINTLSWNQHLMLNITFLLFSISSLLLTKRERRSEKSK